MKFVSFLKIPALISFVFVLLFASVVSAQTKGWVPATREELQMTTPKVEADADAEALLWDVYLTDEDAGGDLQTVLHHYLRIKIFNERGRQSFNKIDIQYGKVAGVGLNIKIKDIAARTTKPDGSVVELKDSDVFERDIIKGDGIKLKAKSFAVPGIETGAIIEYRWKEIRGSVSFYQRLQFAQEIPVELVQYHIKPLSHPEYGMKGQPFNTRNTPFVKDGRGFYMTTVSNVPSFKEEPRMPPEYAVRPWMLLYYAKDDKIDPEKYWKDYSKGEYNTHKGMIKTSDDVKQAAAEAIGSESDPEKKIRLIFDYVRAKIENVFDDRLNLSADDLKKIKENKNTSDTIKQKRGNGHDINMLFVAMAAAAGLDARVVNLPRRSDIFFPKWFTDDYFMRTENIAVKIGDTWKFFDPASRYASYGMLAWEEEGQPALISDSKEPLWNMTPLSPPDKSLEKRTGKFKLLENGTLEGTVKMEFTGHIGAAIKEYNDDDTAQQRETSLKNLVRSNILGSAELSDVNIENVSDPDKPFTYIFKVKVEGYATRTGKRIFVQPNVFERSSKPLFESTQRRYEVYFEFPYSEQDDLTIELPAGYELESPDAPVLVKDNNGIVVNDIRISVSTDNDIRTVHYKRDFMFGNGGNLRFNKEVYPALKGLFELIYRANNHSLTLKQSAKATP
ncbi:MAG: DUF3857 and transglutaminase domain-containing protein [Pyrinomonadaceae bacterium]